MEEARSQRSMEKRLTIRLDNQVLEAIGAWVATGKYNSPSHFVRYAIGKMLEGGDGSAGEPQLKLAERFLDLLQRVIDEAAPTDQKPKRPASLASFLDTARQPYVPERDLIGSSEAAEIFGFSKRGSFTKIFPTLPDIRTETRGKAKRVYYVLQDVIRARFPEMNEEDLSKEITMHRRNNRGTGSRVPAA